MTRYTQFSKRDMAYRFAAEAEQDLDMTTFSFATIKPDNPAPSPRPAGPTIHR